MGSRVNSASINASSTGATAYTVTLGVAVQAGDLIVIAGASQGTHVANGMSASMTATSEAFTPIKDQQGGNASSRWLQKLVYVATQAFLTTDTITFTPYAASTQNDLAVDIFRGWTATIDQAAVGQSNASGTNTAPALGANATAGALVITSIETASGTLTAGTPFSTGSASSTTQASAIGFVLGATGSLTYGSTWTLGTAGTNATITVSFQATATATGAPPSALRRLIRLPFLRRSQRGQPVPAQQAQPAPTYPPQWTRLAIRRLFIPRRGHTPQAPLPALPGPTPVITSQPPRTVLRRLLPPRRGRSAPPPFLTPVTAPPWPLPVVREIRRPTMTPHRPRAATPPDQAAAPPTTPRPHRLALPPRRARCYTPPQTPAAPPPQVPQHPVRRPTPARARIDQPPFPAVVAPPTWPPAAVRDRVRLFALLPRRRPAVPLAATTAPSCTTSRPSTGTTLRPISGTTAYAAATTARPASGVTARPNTGTTPDPC